MSTIEGTSWHTYPSIFNLGHRYIEDLLKDDVLVEEKIDGSQFSFGVFGTSGVADPLTLDVRCRSKGQDIDVHNPEKMFTKAVEWIMDNQTNFHPGWTYRCEFLGKEKHNTLNYDRVPNNNLIVFDINDGEESYLNYIDKHNEAERIGLECVPCLFHGLLSDMNYVKALMDLPSVLGGTKIEGVVIKNYARFGQDKKVLMGKHVSEAFKEEHSNAWRKSNPTGGDIILQIGGKYCHPGRWSKAVQHLRDAGRLEDSPKDIGLLIKEVPEDVMRECAMEINEELMKWAWPKIRREITRGLPGWYKEQLLEKQFVVEDNPNPMVSDPLEAEQAAVIPNKEATSLPSTEPRLGLNMRELKPIKNITEKVKA